MNYEKIVMDDRIWFGPIVTQSTLGYVHSVGLVNSVTNAVHWGCSAIVTLEMVSIIMCTKVVQEYFYSILNTGHPNDTYIK